MGLADVDRRALKAFSDISKLSVGQTYSFRYRMGEHVKRLVATVVTAEVDGLVVVRDRDDRRRLIHARRIVSAKLKETR